jgi:hypothetical protein
MYRRPKFLEVLLEIRQEMARQADYDVDLFAEMVRGAKFSDGKNEFSLNENNAESPAKNRKSPIADRQS